MAQGASTGTTFVRNIRCDHENPARPAVASMPGFRDRDFLHQGA
jgi:hypothetical protein